MNQESQQNLIIRALCRMFDDACEIGSNYESYFKDCSAILFDKATGQLRLVFRGDNHEEFFTISVVTTENPPSLAPASEGDATAKCRCPSCGNTQLRITASAEFEFDGNALTTGPGMGVDWCNATDAECMSCHYEFSLGDAMFEPAHNTAGTTIKIESPAETIDKIIDVLGMISECLPPSEKSAMVHDFLVNHLGDD